MAFPPDAASTLSALRAKATTLIDTTADPLVLWAVVTLLAPHAAELSPANARQPVAESAPEPTPEALAPRPPRPAAPVARADPRPIPPPDLLDASEEAMGGAEYLATPPEHDEAIWRGVVEAERGERARPWREVVANLQMRYGEAT